jgi:hypothetical protein
MENNSCNAFRLPFSSGSVPRRTGIKKRQMKLFYILTSCHLTAQPTQVKKKKNTKSYFILKKKRDKSHIYIPMHIYMDWEKGRSYEETTRIGMFSRTNQTQKSISMNLFGDQKCWLLKFQTKSGSTNTTKS